MIAFVLRIGRASRELDAAAARRLSAFAGSHSPGTLTETGTWNSPGGTIHCRWVAHAPAELGGIEYTFPAGDRFSLFAGRPVLWDGPDADGRRAIDPSSYLGAPPELLRRLDGRFAVIDVADDAVRLVTDPAGLLPIFVSRRGGAFWLANVAPLVSEVTDPIRESTLAAFVVTGNATTGQPMSDLVDRVEPGTLTRFSADGQQSAVPLNRVSPEDFRQGPTDYAQAARDLVAVSAASADWPGRARHVHLTGGYDSRLVGAALREAGVEVSATCMAFEYLPGYPLTEDVELSRTLARLLRFDHHVRDIGDSVPIYRATDAAAAFLRAGSPGTISWEEITDLLLESPPHAPRPLLVFDGVGGEFSRGSFDAHWGRAGNFDQYRDARTPQEMIEGMMRRYVPTHVRSIASPSALNMFRKWLTSFVERAVDEGFALSDVPELCFLEYFGTWHGMKTVPYDYRQDGISPLVSRRLWPAMLSQPLEDRMGARFHRELTALLGPDLHDTPYCSRSGRYGGRQERVRDREWLIHRTELADRADSDPATDPIAGIQRRIMDRIPASKDHPVWKYLDIDRVKELLDADPAHIRHSYPARLQIWRLATVLTG
ncbi:hypothetical protein EDC02_2529 [Micromonospora sp. Llam0]|uniref:hypothetical protein n=1 Tax=Micromonospora sp. Llam0 TaxID=2485143 RepID=UPI000F468BAD|nr:hypothetical protein [Micromonospora sp. Llam0]ROO60618.1 hypothetical protein EDC02_2529 [Micromonospora sp. Llam0]